MLFGVFFFSFSFLSARDRTALRFAALLKLPSQTLFSLADVLLVLAPSVRHTVQVLPGTAETWVEREVWYLRYLRLITSY